MPQNQRFSVSLTEWEWHFFVQSIQIRQPDSTPDRVANTDCGFPPQIHDKRYCPARLSESSKEINRVTCFNRLPDHDGLAEWDFVYVIKRGFPWMWSA